MFYVSTFAHIEMHIMYAFDETDDSWFQIVACHAFNKTDNVTRCSKRAQGSGNTKPDPALDIIDEDSFRILDILEDVSTLSITYLSLPCLIFVTV